MSKEIIFRFWSYPWKD